MMHTTKFFSRCIMTSSLCLVLAACGGGGGGSSSSGGGTTAPNVMTVSTTSSTLNVQERLSTTTTLSVKNADQDITIALDYSGAGNLDYTVNQNTVTLHYTAPEVAARITERFTVTIDDSNQSIATAFNVNVSSAQMTATVVNTDLTVDELLTVSATITVKDADQATRVSFDYAGGGNVSHSVDGETVTVFYTAPDVERSIEEKFSVTLQDSNDSIATEYTVSIDNASANKLIASLEKLIELTQTKGHYSEIITLADTIGKMERFNQTGKLNQINLSHDRLASAIEEYPLWSAIEITVDQLQATIDDFNSGVDDEFDLQSQVDTAQIRITHDSEKIIAELADIMKDSNYITVMPTFDFKMDGTSYSGFIGNAALGEFVDGQWVFNDDYAIFQDIFLSPCSAQ